jgi:hypothetical protein
MAQFICVASAAGLVLVDYFAALDLYFLAGFIQEVSLPVHTTTTFTIKFTDYLTFSRYVQIATLQYLIYYTRLIIKTALCQENPPFLPTYGFSRSG